MRLFLITKSHPSFYLVLIEQLQMPAKNPLAMHNIVKSRPQT